MLDCWNMNPGRRPSFKAIKEELEPRLMQSSNYLYLEQEADTDTGSTQVTKAPVSPNTSSSDPGSGYWTGDQLRTEDDEYLAPTT